MASLPLQRKWNRKEKIDSYPIALSAVMVKVPCAVGGSGDTLSGLREAEKGSCRLTREMRAEWQGRGSRAKGIGRELGNGTGSAGW